MKKYILLISVFTICAKVSYQPEECLSYFNELIDISSKPLISSFFSPDFNLKKLVLALINAEQEFIHAALYRLTDEELAYALIEAHKRGVDIELIVDTSSVYDKYGKVNQLLNEGVPVYVYPSSFFTIFHHKFFLFSKNMENRMLLWTGSANATAAGMTRNEENVLILDDAVIITRYCQQFERLKQRLHRIKMSRRKANSKKEWGKFLMQGLHYYNSFLAWFPGYSSLKKNQVLFSDCALD